MLCPKRAADYLKYLAGLLLALSGGGGGIAFGATLLVPSVTLSQRYDSNVFLIPPTNGINRSDFVSGIVPALNVIDRGDFVQTTAQIAGVAEHYVNNPDLDYIAGSGNLGLNLNRLVQRYIPKLSLTISDAAFYSPLAPTFSTAAFGDEPSAFGRGIQVVRTNTFANSASMVAQYQVTPTTIFRAGYHNEIIRFGNPKVNIGTTGPIDTNSDTVVAGPFVQVNVRDTLGGNFIWQRIVFLGGQAAGLQNGYETYGGRASWQRIWIPEFRTNVIAGASVLTAGSGTTSGGSGAASEGPKNLVVWNGGFSAFWTDRVSGEGGENQNPLTGIAGAGGSGGIGGLGGGGIGSMTGGGAIFGTGARTTALLSYSAGVYPSYFSAGVPLISQVVTFNGDRRLAWSLAMAASVDYARNDSLGAGSGAGSTLSYRAYGGGLALTYLVATGMFVSLKGDYHRFEGEGLAQSGALSGASVSVDRFLGMISLTKVWLP